ncbi:MAG: peptidoglycan DD-metalloendopeptidase family protein [Clostridia bacterium]
MIEDDFDDELEELEDEELGQAQQPEQSEASMLMNKLKESQEKSKASNSKKSNANGKNKPSGGATDKAKGAAKDKAKQSSGDLAKQKTKDGIRKGAGVAAKKAASTAAAAGTAGASKAAEYGIEAAKKVKKVSDNVDRKIEAETGIPIRKIKKTTFITTVMLPILIPILAILVFLSIFDFLQTETAAEDTNDVITTMEGELGKSLLRFTDEDFKALLKKFEDKYKKHGDKSSSYFAKLVNSYTGTETSRLESALSALDMYLKAEKSNFNKVKWAVVNGQNGEKKTPQMYETEDRLQLPIASNSYFGVSGFPEVEEDSTIDLFKGYLQTWSIPLSCHIATSNAGFAKNIVNDMFHVVNAETYQLFQYNKEIKHTHTLKTEAYTETYTCTPDNGKCPNGHEAHEGTVTHSRTAYRVVEPYEIISTSKTEGPLVTSPGGVSSYITYAETFKGIITAPVTLESKSESTYALATGEITINGTPGPNGVSASQTDVETWKDLASQDKPQVEPYVLIEGVVPENLKTNRIQAFMYNKDYSYNKIKFDSTSLSQAFETIKKYHIDAAKEILDKGLDSELWFGASLAWPVPECTLAGYLFKDVPVYPNHTGIDISNEGKITNNHGPEVIAAADGTVVGLEKGSAYSSGYGKYVKIDHGDGLITIYAHLYNVENNITKGMKISEGTKLGFMGTTGNSSGIHTHFEVRQDGVPVDPFNYYLYDEFMMTFGGKYKKVRRYTGRKVAIDINSMEFTEAWNKKLSDLIQEAISMTEAACMEYSQTQRPIEYDKRPNIGDCSSFVANLYYRYFDKAYIGGYSVPQYEMSDLRNIKAYSVENWLDSNGNIDTNVVRPGDVIVNRNIHTMLYIGSAKPVKGPGTIIDHGHGQGPKYNDFNRLSASYKAQCRVIRYYRDDAIKKPSAGASGGGEYPRFSQHDSKWGGKPYSGDTISGAGCAPSTMAMAITGLGGNMKGIDTSGDGVVTPDESAVWSTNHGGAANGQGSYNSFINNIAKAAGLTAVETTDSNKVLQALKDGKPVVDNVRPGTICGGHHFLLLVGVDNNGKIKMNDPNDKVGSWKNSNKAWDFSVIVSETKAFWILDNPNLNPQQRFIQKAKAGAIEGYKKYGVLPSVTIAQATFESGWGKDKIAVESNNYFGIKASGAWKGPVKSYPTMEYINGSQVMINADFRVYGSMAESMEDHGKFLRENSRYASMFSETTARGQLEALRRGGYATNPTYASELMNQIKYYNLEAIDAQAKK